jgi:acylphosphatase
VGDEVRLTACVYGRVQGVGFRAWTRYQAVRLGLVGEATNLVDGQVEVVAEGPRDQCERLLEMLRGPGAPGRVSRVVDRWGEPHGRATDFRVG